MARVLIVFDTSEGHTEKIASRMGELAVRAGHSVETYDVGHLPASCRSMRSTPYSSAAPSTWGSTRPSLSSLCSTTEINCSR